MTAKYPIFSKEPPSDMFLESLNGHRSGSPHIECYCGRNHYCPDSQSYNGEDEFELEAREEKKLNPAGVVLHEEYDAVMAIDMGGPVYVIDCECNSLRRYEDIFWNSKSIIQSYFPKREAYEKEMAEQQLIVDKLKGIRHGTEAF